MSTKREKRMVELIEGKHFEQRDQYGNIAKMKGDSGVLDMGFASFNTNVLNNAEGVCLSLWYAAIPSARLTFCFGQP